MLRIQVQRSVIQQPVRFPILQVADSMSGEVSGIQGRDGQVRATSLWVQQIIFVAEGPGISLLWCF
jgi:hypothetical protein